eukprot:TRINITY_DN10668_c0_g1_i1.p1 TRINITY_DN10668_c0_g1~~TRINITY_DN10668_c0_g1_i1.p1  ORF type:complete len:187 (-),score=43.67 TRINITY_DN10668_c0_g1_i1:57-545(-)
MVKDDEIGSSALAITSSLIHDTFITSPNSRLHASLGISLPHIAFIVKTMDAYFSFEIEVVDDKLETRRFRASNFQDTTRVKEYICTMPLRLPDTGWNYIHLNLADLVRRVYGSGFKHCVRVTVHANCHLRRVFFSDKPITEEQLPAEMKLFAAPSVSTSATS